LPGRKNLIWFSGSFPINILPNEDLLNPFSVVASAEDEFRETSNLLARSQVAVYPIDARGLMTMPMMSAANSGSKYTRNPTAFGKDLSTFYSQSADEQSTMNGWPKRPEEKPSTTPMASKRLLRRPSRQAPISTRSPIRYQQRVEGRLPED